MHAKHVCSRRLFSEDLEFLMCILDNVGCHNVQVPNDTQCPGPHLTCTLSISTVSVWEKVPAETPSCRHLLVIISWGHRCV